MRRRTTADRLLNAIALVILIGGWELISRIGKVSLFVSSPIRVSKYALNNPFAILSSISTTGAESLGGLLAAAIVSCGIAVLFYVSPRLQRFAYPWVAATQIIPFVAIAPAVVLVFGPSSIWGKVFLSAVVAFFPILSNVLAGLKTIRKESLELMQLLAVSRFHTFGYVVVPHVAHHFFAGLFIAAPLCVIGAVIAEFNGARFGLGKDIFIAAKRLEPELMVSGILGSAFLAAVIAGTVKLIESFLGSWYTKEN